jgi:transcriptional regulator with XRE-family HTH domain
MNTAEFAKKLKEARVLKGESPNELGAKLGVGVKQIQRYESGELPPPHESLIILCQHYGVDFISILYDLKRLKENINNDVPLDNPMVERLLAEKDNVAKKIEEKAKLAEEYAAEMKQHYEDSKAEKAELFSALKETRQQISKVLQPMAASLMEIPPVLDTIVRNSNEHDKEIMKALDHLVGNAPGTLAKESGKRILKGAMEQQKTGKAEVGKTGKQI